MKKPPIAIIGGGLSGLYAAYLLEQRGYHECVLFEARDRLGGRILSAVQEDNLASGNRFDLGPSWYWPDIQTEMDGVVAQLGLVSFEQFELGDQVVEPPNKEPPFRMRGYVNMPPSMRIAGGMAALIDALRSRLKTTQIITGAQVRSLRILENTADINSELEVSCDGHQTASHKVAHVLLALPPRLAQHSIRFEPALPTALATEWAATPTWMAPHAKYVAVYSQPFWREFGLSGAAQSARGPLAEIHDASIPEGKGALFGFFGVAAAGRDTVDKNTLLTLCRQQLVRLFGPAAATPEIEFLSDWAKEVFTATPADFDGTGEHPEAPAATATSSPWQDRIIGVGSEWSPQFSGYLAGAIEAAHLGVQHVLKANTKHSV